MIRPINFFKDHQIWLHDEGERISICMEVDGYETEVASVEAAAASINFADDAAGKLFQDHGIGAEEVRRAVGELCRPTPETTA